MLYTKYESSGPYCFEQDFWKLHFKNLFFDPVTYKCNQLEWFKRRCCLKNCWRTHRRTMDDGQWAITKAHLVLRGAKNMLKVRLLPLTLINPKKSYHSFQYFSKDNMSTIEPLCFLSCDEELRSISVLASISHAQPTRSIMLQLEVLIREFLSINALA